MKSRGYSLNFSLVKSSFQRPTGYSQLSNTSFHFPSSVSSRGCLCKAILNKTARTAGKNLTVQVKKMVRAHSGGFDLSGLTSLSPWDGRYWGKVKELTPNMSEYGLIYYRILVEITKAGEIGSSTMPHKVNPIDFEIVKEILQWATEVNEDRLSEDLNLCWEVLAEPI